MKTIPPKDLTPATGRRYWRSLDQLAGSPEFKQWLEREFPQGASELNDPVSRRHFVKIMSASFMLAGLGLAGTGFEQPVAGQLTSGDEQTVREALRSLARMGTPQAAALVRSAIERANGWLASAGAETLWHFPANEAHRQVRELLGKREFVIRQPIVAARLLDRATQSGATGLQPILVTLAPLRYRLWRPALVRVGRRARTLLER